MEQCYPLGGQERGGLPDDVKTVVEREWQTLLSDKSEAQKRLYRSVYQWHVRWAGGDVVCSVEVC